MKYAKVNFNKENNKELHFIIAFIIKFYLQQNKL